mmetsp:Transcript_66553/g.109568  ORF Transcript_66553/g.109568 Transcript_66553/m.109568 type:complete len:239 (-) Transcript_66553:7-723(-)
MGRSASRSRDGPASNGKDKGGDGKREKGTINTWNADRQFGFVSCDSGRQDLFTHAEYITDTNARYDAKTRGLRRGDRIAFDVEEPQGSKKSMQAVNVEILDLVKRSRSPSRRRSRSRRSRRTRCPCCRFQAPRIPRRSRSHPSHHSHSHPSRNPSRSSCSPWAWSQPSAGTSSAAASSSRACGPPPPSFASPLLAYASPCQCFALPIPYASSALGLHNPTDGEKQRNNGRAAGLDVET